MQKISVDLIRLAISCTVISAVVEVAVAQGLLHSDKLGSAKVRVAPPIQVKTISVGAPALCWTIDEPIDGSAPQDAQAKRAPVAQTCSDVAPSLRRLSEPQGRLAMAP
jgi:hypothetical protein